MADLSHVRGTSKPWMWPTTPSLFLYPCGPGDRFCGREGLLPGCSPLQTNQAAFLVREGRDMIDNGNVCSCHGRPFINSTGRKNHERFLKKRARPKVKIKAWRDDRWYPRCTRCKQTLFPGQQRRFVESKFGQKIMVCTGCAENGVENDKTPTVGRVTRASMVSPLEAQVSLVKHEDNIRSA